jgi:hypothetical protein
MLLNVSAALGAWFLLSIPIGMIVGRMLRGRAAAPENSRSVVDTVHAAR